MNITLHSEELAPETDDRRQIVRIDFSLEGNGLIHTGSPFIASPSLVAPDMERALLARDHGELAALVASCLIHGDGRIRGTAKICRKSIVVYHDPSAPYINAPGSAKYTAELLTEGLRGTHYNVHVA